MRASGILVASAIAVTLTASIVSGEYVSYISIDGQIDDWGLSLKGDNGNDVVPDNEPSIDVVGYSTKIGYFYRGEKGDRDARNAVREAIFGQGQVSEHWEFAFFLMFIGEPFSEPDETTVEVLFSNSDVDVSAPASELFGSAFFPTASLVITGKDGCITGVETRSWRNGRWISTGQGETLPGVEVATQDNLLEGAVRWGSLGYPLPPDVNLTRLPVSLHYGIITSVRTSRDVIGPKFRMVTTSIHSDSWSGVKASRTDGTRGPR